MESERLGEEAKIDDKTMTCELEAAEALEAMARCSSVSELPKERVPTESVCTHFFRGLQGSKLSGIGSTSVDNPVNPEQNDEITTSQMCSAGYASNSVSKSRQTLTKADKEAQRRRRVLANRESARRTIRRRQELYSDLTHKEAELSAENQHLKREKELVLKEHNSLKTRNECFKLQMAKIKEAKTKEIQEESNSAQAEKSSSVFLCNQSFGFPYFWPPIGPTSDVFQVQCALHANAAMSSQLPLQLSDVPCSHPGKDTSTSLNTQGAPPPIFVFPVPWPFPFLAQSSTPNSQPALNDRQNENSPSCRCCAHSSSDTPPVHADDHQLLPIMKKKPEASSSGTRFSVSPGDGGQQLVPQPKGATHVSAPPNCIGRTTSFRRWTSAQPDDSSGVKALSSDTEHMAQTLVDNKKVSIWSSGKSSKDNTASTEARRKRKELLKLKRLHSHYDGTSSKSSGNC